MEIRTKALLRMGSSMVTASGRKNQGWRGSKGTVTKETTSWIGKTVGDTSSGKVETATEGVMWTMNVRVSEKCDGQMALSTEVAGTKECNMVQVLCFSTKPSTKESLLSSLQMCTRAQ